VGSHDWDSYIGSKHKKMELLYFISGILSVGILYSISLLRTVKSSHTELLKKHQSQSAISSARFYEYKDELEDVKLLLGDIQGKMEKDQYESVSEINKRIEKLDTLLKDTIGKIEFASQSNNKNFSTSFNEIQQLKNNIKALGQDPNMLSRY
jgi:proteasome assembly chaperone (PAC2) family protein